MGILSVPVIWLADLSSDVDFSQVDFGLITHFLWIKYKWILFYWNFCASWSWARSHSVRGSHIRVICEMRASQANWLWLSTRWVTLWLTVSLLTQWGGQTRIILKNLGIAFIEITWTFNSEGVIFLSFPLHFLIELVPSVSIWILASCTWVSVFDLFWERNTQPVAIFAALSIIKVAFVLHKGFVFFWFIHREFPSSPVVKTLCFHCQTHGFDPWSGN